MINIDRVKKLIDQIPEIKALFRPQNFQMFAPCDRATGQRKNLVLSFKQYINNQNF